MANINSNGQLILTFSDGKTVNLDKVVGMNGTDGISISSSNINSDGELVITYSNGQTANLGVVVGAQGIQGAQGLQGIQGEKGDKGAQGAQGIQGEKGVSVTKTEINNNGELIITLSDNTVSNLGVVVGAKGEQGAQGIQGEKGDKGEQGAQGIQGEKGDKGEQGAQGIQGKQGVGIETIVVENNNLKISLTNGTNLDLGNIKGEQGIQGIQGEKGDKGEQGIQGIQGEQGVGISDVDITNDELVITLSNNTVLNLGNIKGAQGEQGFQGIQGEQGVGILSVVIDDDGHLKITLTTGTTTDLGNVKGTNGQDGVGIDKIFIQDGNLYVKKTNDTSPVNLGSIKGEKGDKGDTGEQGPAGLNGTNGVDGKSAYELYKQAHPEYTGTLEEWLNGLKGNDGRGIVKTEIINGHLWITYSDDLDTPVDLGSISISNAEGTDGLEYYPLPDGTYGVKVGNALYLENIVIPSVYNGKTVTTIMENGFEAMRNLKTITIPNSITTIEKYAFSDCTVLETADIPDTVTSIGAYAFNNCSSLTKITIPTKLTVIEEYAFYGCTGAVRNTITIPKSITKIKPHALEISKDIGIFFEEASTWGYTSELEYSYRDGSSRKYNRGTRTINVSTETNYSDYFYGKKIRLYIDSDEYWDVYLQSQECTWTKQ